MTISIKKIVDDERGSISIEATFITLFFVAVLSFSLYQGIQYVQYLKSFKIANQIADIISQRNIFFSGRDLSSADGAMLKDVLEALVPDYSHQQMTVIIEEQAYATGNYNHIELSPVQSYCQIKKRLVDYGINVMTSFGKRNAIYRVTVCLKNHADLFSDTPDVVVGVAIQSGHHH